MMESLHYPDLAARVLAQPQLQPSLYGDVDFTAKPYRLADGPDDESRCPAGSPAAARSSRTSRSSSS